MATKTVAWSNGSGDITLDYTGVGDGTIVISSDENNLDTARQQDIVVETTRGGTVQRTVTVRQAAGPNFRDCNGLAYIPLDADYFNVQVPNS